jgi:hypothetical protein
MARDGHTPGSQGGPPLFHPPNSLLVDLPGWDAPVGVDASGAAANWLAGCDQEQQDGFEQTIHRLAGSPHPPRTVGPSLQAGTVAVHDLGDGLVLSVAHPLGAKRVLWWPVLLSPGVQRNTVQGYTLTWNGRRLWASEDDLAITDSEGEDVPPSIFARRVGPDALRRAFAQRDAALLDGLERFAIGHRPPPTCLGGIVHAHSPWARRHVWEPWRPQRPTPTLPPSLADALRRFARILAPGREVPEGTRLALRGGHPQQDGRLSPLALVWTTSLWGDSYPTPSRAALDGAARCLQQAGLLGFLERQPWVSGPLDPAGMGLVPEPGPVSAHGVVADLAWAMGLGWVPPAG